MPATTRAPQPESIERAVRAAKEMYPPPAEIKVRRGRVVAVEGDLIRWLRYENLDSSHK